MDGATLVAHCGARKVSYAELAALPVPVPRGRWHRPLAHVEVVDLLKEFVNVSSMVKREEYAVQTNGKKLFGVFDMEGNVFGEGRGYSVGFRASQDESFALRVVAGTRVFVCDNLALSGSDVVLNRKQTIGLSLRETLRYSVNKLFEQYSSMDRAIARMQQADLLDTAAKALVYDAFVKEDLPLRLFPHVNEWYFDPKHEHADATDCAPRSVWGLHNAFTRAIKVIESPVRQFEVTQGVGRYLGLNA